MARKDVEATRRINAAADRSHTRDSQEIKYLLGKVRSHNRRKLGLTSLQKFCEIYFAVRCCDPWSLDHLRVLGTLEDAARHGGKFALAMPRGSGKSCMAEAAVLFAILLGTRRFACLIGATAEAAGELLESVKRELTSNEKLRQDFPLEVGPFELLEGESRRCAGQRYDGEKTGIQWKADRIVFAWIPGSKAAGAVIRVAGITGRLHGMKHTRPDGMVIRPEFAVIDDPQTMESATSLTQINQRERLIKNGVLGLAGPRVKMTAVMLCTVFARNDVADRLLDRSTHPEWQGERTKTLYSFPSDLEKWKEYKRLWSEDKAAGGDGSIATDYYRDNREAMDAGAQVAWIHRIKDGDLSAIQSAMHDYLFDRIGFMANAQNEPEDESVAVGGRLDPRAVAERWNGRPAGEVPLRTEQITAHVDVHDDILYYQVCAFEAGYTGTVIDYGTWPKQSGVYFSQTNVHNPLSAIYPNRGKEGTIYAGLADLLGQLTQRSYRRDDGAQVPIGLCLVDWGYVPDIVGKAITALNRGPQLMAAKGFGLGPSRKPYSEYKKEAGVRQGQHFRIAPNPQTKTPILHVDTNWWKSFYRDRLRCPVGDPGALTVFGERPDQHRLWADHCGSQYPVQTTGPWGTVEEWKLEPGRDDHWWDTGVGCCVAAAVLGIKMDAWQDTVRKRPDWSNAPSMAQLAGRR